MRNPRPTQAYELRLRECPSLYNPAEDVSQEPKTNKIQEPNLAEGLVPSPRDILMSMCEICEIIALGRPRCGARAESLGLGAQTDRPLFSVPSSSLLYCRGTVI